MGHGNGDLIGNYAIRSVGKRHPAAGLLTTTTNLSKFVIEIALSKQAARQLAKSGVGVEKGTKAVISANSSVCGERTFNNLRTNFVIEIP